MRASFKRIFFKKHRLNISGYSDEKSNILFLGHKPNRFDRSQYRTIKPIYNYLKTTDRFNPIYYLITDNSIPFKIVSKLIKILFQIRKNWLGNQQRIHKNMRYKSLKLNCIINEFYNLNLNYYIVTCFFQLYHFKKFIRSCSPAIIIYTEFFGAPERLLLRFCKLKKIPTISIPICANSVVEEAITQSDLSYITVSGNKEKDYFTRKGEPSDKIIITGRSVYEKVYKEKLEKLSEVRDMFDNRIYKFEPNKFTILINASVKDQDKKIAEVMLLSAFRSLKRLNLQDNLILKLHPMEDGIVHREILKKMNYSPLIVRDVNIFELMKSCDLFLTSQSTTIIEAMIIGIPIIVMDLSNLPYEMEMNHQYFEDRELLIIVENEKELTDRMQKLITDRDYIENYSKNLKELSKGYSFYDKDKDSYKILVDLFLKIID